MYRPAQNIKQLRRKGLPWLGAALILLLIVIIVTILFFVLQAKAAYLHRKPEKSLDPLYAEYDADPSNENTGSSSIFEDKQPPERDCWPRPSRSSKRTFRNSAVTSQEELCSEIGRNILMTNGTNAVDSAVAVSMCLSALSPQNTGLGGGILITIHLVNGSSVVVDGTSSAPRTASPMTYAINPMLAVRGFSSIAVPGWLGGLWTAYEQFGSKKVPWAELLAPTIKLLEQGHPVSVGLYTDAQLYSTELASEKSMSLFLDNLAEGGIRTDSKLANTLRRLAEATSPAQFFYEGEIATQIAKEMKDRGGLITKSDLSDYHCRVTAPLRKAVSEEFELLGPPPPSTFAAVLDVVQKMLELHENKTAAEKNESVFYEDLIGILQRSLSLEMAIDANTDVESLTSDSAFTGEEILDIAGLSKMPAVVSDRVASHVNVVAPDGTVVSLSSSLNSRFGSHRRSELGFVWNNQMKAFSSESYDDPELSNAVEGSKRPRTSMMPLILMKDGKPVMSLGVTGQAHSVATAATTIIKYILGERSNPVDTPRFYATTNGALFEGHTPLSLLSNLTSSGVSLSPLLSSASSCSHSLLLHPPSITTFSDFRCPHQDYMRGF